MKRSVHRLLCAVLGCILLLGVLAGANTAMAEAAASGKCGKDLVWSFDPATGVITIEGEGAMWDYDSAKLLPWAAYASNIKKVVIKSGVTSVGKNAFSGCAVEEVEFADTLEAIGQNAFRNCENLAAVDLTNTKVQTIAAGAFVGCEKLTTEAVKLPETVVSVSATAFEEKVEVKKELIKQNPVETPAETTEVSDGAKHWTEESFDLRFEYTELADGTLVCVAYKKDGEIYYTSTTTHVEDGHYHEEFVFADGSVVIDDFMVDADYNKISGERYEYDGNKVLRDKTLYWNKNGTRYQEKYDENDTLLSKSESFTDENDVTTYVETSFQPNGETQTHKSVTWTKDGTQFNKSYIDGVLRNETSTTYVEDGKFTSKAIFYGPDGSTETKEGLYEYGEYEDNAWENPSKPIHTKTTICNANGEVTYEIIVDRLEDGLYRENTTSKTQESINRSEKILTADYQLVQETFENQYTYGAVEKGQTVANGDGTATKKWTREDSGGTRIEEEKTYYQDSNKVLKSSTIIKDKNGEIIRQHEQNGMWNEDGTFTSTSVTKDPNRPERERTTRLITDANDKLVENYEETTFANGSKYTITRKNNADGSETFTEENISPNGDKSKYTRVNKDGEELSSKSEYYGTVTNEDGTVTKVSTIEDKSGKVTSKRTEDASGNLVELSEITYDENGNGHEKVYDKDNNLIWEGTEGTRPAGTAQTLELPQGVAVAVEPAAEKEPAKEQPTEEKTTEEEPTEEQPGEEKPSEEKPTEEQPGEEKPDEEQPTEEQPTEEQPTEEQPTEEQPNEEKPTEEKPSEEQPSEEQPSEEQSTEEQPSEEQPSEEQPTEEQPSEEQPTEEQPSEEKPTQEQPAEQPKGESEAAVLPVVGEKIAVVVAA